MRTFFCAVVASLTLLSPLPSLSRLSPLRPRHSFSILPSSQTHADASNHRRPFASALLSLFAGKQQAASVNATLADQILSCVRSLVPDPSSVDLSGSAELYELSLLFNEEPCDFNPSIITRLIRWPPLGVAELAKRAVMNGGDPAFVLKALDSTLYTIPDVEGANEQKCILGKYTDCRRFADVELNTYMAFLFEAIAALAPSVDFDVSLSRFDLFHGHIFLANGTGRLGILFHAREYPAYSKGTFPVNLGYCQRGSHVLYDNSINFRNIIWLAPMPDCSNKKCSNRWLAPGTLFLLDARPGGIIYEMLVPEDVEFVRTIYEDDFGVPVADVNYFNLLDREAEDRIFIC